MYSYKEHWYFFPIENSFTLLNYLQHPDLLISGLYLTNKTYLTNFVYEYILRYFEKFHTPIADELL